MEDNIDIEMNKHEDNILEIDEDKEMGRSSKSNAINAEWTSYYEEIFANWCDNAMCYRYLHSNCNRHYSYMNILFTIPVIGISTLTGVANFAQDKIPEDYRSYYTICVGAFNILAGFISTISQFLKISELNESHRVSSISWSKLQRNIKIELTKKPCEREAVYTYLKKTKEQYDLLIEVSPEIPRKEIISFNNKFKENTFFKPEICGELVSVKESMYKREPNAEEDLQAVVTIRNKRESIMKNVEIDNFVKNFLTHQQRQPSVIEIYDNLEDTISKEHIDEYVNNFSNRKISNTIKLKNAVNAFTKVVGSPSKRKNKGNEEK
jgi:hypothetical protein